MKAEREQYIELKDCPFCGSKAMGAKIDKNPLWFAVFCLGENCHASNRGETEEKAIAAWNKRVERCTGK